MSHSKIKFVFSAMLHLLGILVLFAIFVGLFVSESTATIIFSIMSEEQVSAQILTPLVITLGLSTVIWGVGAVALSSLNRPQVRTLKRARGSAMVETLIVLPVFFLLTSGLAQMGINSMAGLLTTVGAFQAARTIAVWGPEIGNQRISGVTPEDVLIRARLAVAVIVAPVARANTDDVDLCQELDPDHPLNAFLDGMQHTGMNTNPVGTSLEVRSFMESFGGTQTFAERGPAKLKSAYCAVTVEPSSLNGIPNSGTDGGDFLAAISYDHKPVFPLVGHIFSNSNIERSYQLRSQLPPNDCLPETPDFFSITSCTP